MHEIELIATSITDDVYPLKLAFPPAVQVV